jgi:hypothetical protein
MLLINLEDYMNTRIKFAKRYAESLKSKAKDLIPGGLAEGISYLDFDQEQLAKGIKVEMEHTNDVLVATEIAKDHLVEDAKYYDKLETIEPDHAAYDEQAQGPGPNAPGGHYGYALDNAIAAQRYKRKLNV